MTFQITMIRLYYIVPFKYARLPLVYLKGAMYCNLIIIFQYVINNLNTTVIAFKNQSLLIQLFYVLFCENLCQYNNVIILWFFEILSKTLFQANIVSFQVCLTAVSAVERCNVPQSNRRISRCHKQFKRNSYHI